MRLLQIDAFASEPFRGNPAAVCMLEAERDEQWMQSVAAEMNVSATAFPVPRDDGFALRWFTPVGEIPLCGHGTLAAAHALWEEKILAHDEPARFHTKAGPLTATRAGELIELDFPAIAEESVEPPPGLLDALGVTAAIHVGKNRLDYLVEVESDDIVRKLTPDHARLSRIVPRGVIVTSRATGDEFDFVSRFFAPAAGLPEDPVTGSSHCCLAPYWSARLGKDAMVAFQASARGGVVHVRVAGDRVKIAGRARTVLRGELVV
ncbi:MAG TPA: PhzF family phenazine biosynthesis protein [Thermoanaerobaculia bacterium]|nr:PhzF family phenazine biosynthesis protein [Thermoanaerobaculia bacterium]